MFYKFAAAIALSFAAVPAMAQDAPLNEVDGWFIAEVREGVCQMVAPIQGQTMVSFIASDTLPGMIVLVDLSWQLNDGAPYDVRYSSDGWRTSQAMDVKARKSSNGRYTLAGSLDVAATQTIRRAKRLAIRAPALDIDGAVTLPDSALAELSRCIAGK